MGEIRATSADLAARGRDHAACRGARLGSSTMCRSAGARRCWKARRSPSRKRPTTTPRWARDSARRSSRSRCEYDPGELAAIEAPDQRLGSGVRRSWPACRAAAAESRSRLPHGGQAGAGIDEGPRPSDLPRAGDVRRNHAVLPHGAWQSHEYTFPDYRRADYHAFFQPAAIGSKSRG